MLFMPRIYLGKSLFSAASTGALSTDMRAPTVSGDRKATVMAIFAPLRGQSLLARELVMRTNIEWPIKTGSRSSSLSMKASTSSAMAL